MKRVFFLVVMVSLSWMSTALADVAVRGIGRAAGEGKLAKQQALADALRDAIQKGAGVNLIAQSQVTNYLLDYDRIFAQAFGYIKSFKIISGGVDNAGLYTVEISAVVGKGTPDMNDYLAMRQIIAMKGAPRLLIRTSGEISGIGDSKALIAGMLREIALKCGFNTIRIDQFKEAEDRRARRDEHLGSKDSASYRQADIKSNYDFVIDAEISGAYKGEGKLYGTAIQNFALGADLGATWLNGRAIAQVTVPSAQFDIATISDPSQAARSALVQMLGGDKDKNFRALLLRTLTEWVAEFDTGTKITVEFAGINRELFDKVVDGLKQSEGINGIHVREFDKRLGSTIEVDSRLDTHTLAALVKNLSDNKLEIDRTTSDYIQTTPAPAKLGNCPGWLIITGIIALTIVIALTILLTKRQ